MWGAIATGLWATKAINPAGADGLFYGSSDLLVAQLISIGVACVLAVAGSFILFKLVSAFMDVRMADADETAGLDIVEHGERGYAQAFLTGNQRRRTQQTMPIITLPPPRPHTFFARS